jgi:multisubunit Na+/H+ antiporter MnhE subunit
MVRILILIMRSVVWSTLGAAAITALIVWRASPEFPMTRHIVVAWFGIMWGLCLIPSLALELLTARLELQIGDVRDRKR